MNHVLSYRKLNYKAVSRVVVLRQSKQNNISIKVVHNFKCVMITRGEFLKIS